MGGGREGWEGRITCSLSRSLGSTVTLKVTGAGEEGGVEDAAPMLQLEGGWQTSQSAWLRVGAEGAGWEPVVPGGGWQQCVGLLVALPAAGLLAS